MGLRSKRWASGVRAAGAAVLAVVAAAAALSSAGCLASSGPGEAMPGATDDSLPPVVTVRAAGGAFVRGNGTFAAYLDQRAPVDPVSVVGGVEWVVAATAPVVEAPCAPWPVHLGASAAGLTDHAEVPPGLHLLLAQTGFDTEAGYGSGNATVAAGTPVPLLVEAQAFAFSGVGTPTAALPIELHQPALVVVYVSREGPVKTITPSVSIGGTDGSGCALMEARAPGAGEVSQRWHWAAALVMPGKWRVEASVPGHTAAEPPLGGVQVFAGDVVPALLAGPAAAA